MNAIRWLTREEVIQLNRWTVEQTGEPHALISPDLLASALAKPINHHAYNGMDDMLWLAIVLMFAIARNHPFQQGNKRTAFHAARVFLRRGGFDLPPMDDGIADMMIDVINGDRAERDVYDALASSVVDLPDV